MLGGAAVAADRSPEGVTELGGVGRKWRYDSANTSPASDDDDVFSPS